MPRKQRKGRIEKTGKNATIRAIDSWQAEIDRSLVDPTLPLDVRVTVGLPSLRKKVKRGET